MTQPALQTELLASFEPLLGLLRDELVAADIAPPAGPPQNLAAFTRWYLDAVQLLEQQVTRDEGEASMARDAVEMMCRSALTAPDLASAIDICCRFSAMLYPRAGQLSLLIKGDTALLQLDSLRLRTTTASSLVDITGLFAYRQLLQWLSGRELPLQQVFIGPIVRENVLPFLKLFRAPVLSGGEHYALVFDRRAMSWPCVRSGSEFPAFFQGFPCAVFGLHSGDLSEQVSALLSAALERGRGLPTQAEIAATLEIPLSTLRRRLRERGSSFRLLREQCLKEAATKLLQRRELSVGQVASHLGFSDSAAFRRAFHQWFACAPLKWRQAQQLAE
ncbi:helix-turn-helix domain-containing protein [Parahaliea sp. F7430]|uniref:Helix-turn-helix domain-containing protein n=1 Tax=Sediminihaliea albiluteola TaxID=2758564 RepID=A0A7W2YHX7_9GAMM|nr:helix-turn-helix domain-containing protein [Sediminihaliea albiluteola]MBA6411906.1 helix-turn-helix domain-containing protein [Sediminihaliea albiluteola]